MRNGDMPAMPFEGGENNGMQPWSGLTKREHFASLAMQGILASDTDAVIAQDICVKLAVEHADALLTELEKGGES